MTENPNTAEEIVHKETRSFHGAETGAGNNSKRRMCWEANGRGEAGASVSTLSLRIKSILTVTTVDDRLV